MKDSGIEWIDDIPTHWNIGFVKQIYDIQLGKMLQPRAIGNNDLEVSYLRAENVQWHT
jgi:type I restriction enzyme S subunit